MARPRPRRAVASADRHCPGASTHRIPPGASADNPRLIMASRCPASRQCAQVIATTTTSPLPSVVDGSAGPSIQQIVPGSPLGWSEVRSAREGRALPTLTSVRRSAELSAIFVLDADDVVLAQIGAALDFDEVERNLAGIGQAVRRAGGNVGRLVLLQ